MQVEFLSSFSKDLNKLSSKPVRKTLKNLIQKLEEVNSISDIPNVKKLIGFRSAYRIGVGGYRLGVFYESNILQLAGFVHQKDIYKVFP